MTALDVGGDRSVKLYTNGHKADRWFHFGVTQESASGNCDNAWWLKNTGTSRPRVPAAMMTRLTPNLMASLAKREKGTSGKNFEKCGWMWLFYNIRGL
jgi:hypothetical protein